MNNYKKQIESFSHWSFSRLQSFHDCKLAWKLKYIDELKGLNNSWAVLGSFVHELLEELSKDNITVSELPILFREGYVENVPDEFPSFAVDLHVHYLHKIGRYFDVFPEMGEAIGVELEFKYKLPDGTDFLGFIDRINRKKDGIHAIDWKISKRFTKKKLLEKRRQIHFYFEAIKNEFNEEAKDGFFIFVQDGTYHKVENNPYHVKETMDWAVKTIEQAKQETEWNPILEGMNEEEIKGQKMFCNCICSFRDICEKKKEVYGE